MYEVKKKSNRFVSCPIVFHTTQVKIYQMWSNEYKSYTVYENSRVEICEHFKFKNLDLWKLLNNSKKRKNRPRFILLPMPADVIASLV